MPFIIRRPFPSSPLFSVTAVRPKFPPCRACQGRGSRECVAGPLSLQPASERGLGECRNSFSRTKSGRIGMAWHFPIFVRYTTQHAIFGLAAALPFHSMKRKREPAFVLQKVAKDPVTFQLDNFEHIQPFFVKYVCQFLQATCTFLFPLHAVKRERCSESKNCVLRNERKSGNSSAREWSEVRVLGRSDKVAAAMKLVAVTDKGG